MKAIILTYADITKKEKELLKNTDIFKIACNCAELKPNIRLCADDIVDKCLKCDSCPVISRNYDLERERVINGCYLPNRHSSLLLCLDWLYLNGYTQVLLVATNPENTQTSKINYDGINDMKDCLYLYKYTKDGNFDIPYITIKEFLMLTDEEILLGAEEAKKPKLIKKTVFSDACQYEVHTKGYNNKSIENGNLIENILPSDMKQRILNGESEIEYNNLIIKRLTKLTPEKEEKQPEIEAEPVAKKVVKKTTKKKVK